MYPTAERRRAALDPRLYLVTDSTGLDEVVFLEKLRGALRGGVTLLQLREKDRSTREYIALAQKVHQITAEFDVPLLIDDRIDVAMATDAEGVHLGQSDMPIGTARKILGEGYLIGATAKTVGQAKEAYLQGADYLGVGAIYPTTTKVKTVLTDVSVLSEIIRAVPIPVNAIGGLNKDNIDILRGLKLGGICVVSAIMKADDAQTAAEALSSAMRNKLEI